MSADVAGPGEHRMPDPFPQPNWDLINQLAQDPPTVRNLRPWGEEDHEVLAALPEKYHLWGTSMGEIYQEVVIAHHLLTMAGIPEPLPYAGDLDARVSTALLVLADRVERLHKITEMHSEDPHHPGMCRHRHCRAAHPCPTNRAARGIE